MELKNKIVTGSSKQFKSPGEGNHIMGLVTIKDCIKKFQNEEKPGIMFVFKSVSDPDATICHRVSTSLNPKSSLFKTLRRMAPGLVTEGITPDGAYELLGKLEDRWYDVAVVENKGNDGRIWANVDDCLVKPAKPEACPKVKPSEFFPTFKPAEKAVAKEEDVEIPF